MKQNQTERIYENLNGFELRFGKFYNYNPTIDPEKFEIRILHQDPELALILLEKIKEWVSEVDPDMKPVLCFWCGKENPALNPYCVQCGNKELQ